MKRFLVSFLALVAVLGVMAVVDSGSVAVADGPTTTELYYDDGELDFGWATGPFGGGAVLFTPPTTPWVLSRIKVMAWYWLNDAPFFIEIWDSDRQELFTGTYMYSDYFTSHPADWAEIDIPDIVIEEDFYVGVFGNWAETHFLALGVDDDLPISWRSFAVRYDNNTVDYIEEWNWMIRAIETSIVPLVIDFDPNTLNLKSKGKVVTVYIELPEGYDVEEIDISTVMLNGMVPALTHPIEIDDYDSDGVPDMMVKFDRSDVQSILEPGHEFELVLSGRLTDGTPFEGTDTIRVIE